MNGDDSLDKSDSGRVIKKFESDNVSEDKSYPDLLIGLWKRKHGDHEKVRVF
jgi:hypothetical protein